MIERTPILNIATHAILVFGLIIILVPIWLAFVGCHADPARGEQRPDRALAGRPALGEPEGGLGPCPISARSSSTR